MNTMEVVAEGVKLFDGWAEYRHLQYPDCASNLACRVGHLVRRVPKLSLKNPPRKRGTTLLEPVPADCLD